MALHVLRLQHAEYDDVKGELTFVLEASPENLPPPHFSVRERPDLVVVDMGVVRIGPVRVPKGATPAPVATWTDPNTLQRWTATWDSKTQAWSSPVPVP